jgi:hypothetical protein
MKDKQNKDKQNKVKSCCTHEKKDKQCIRTKDKKLFNLPRRFDREICLSRDIKGFSMKSSCAPYKDCSRKQFLYNKDDPSRSFNVYIDKDPSDTIPIKYKTVQDVKDTIKKLERLYKTDKYTHKRIWQVGMIMYVRLKVLKDKKPEEFKLSEKYFKFLKQRTKKKTMEERKKMIFKFN